MYILETLQRRKRVLCGLETGNYFRLFDIVKHIQTRTLWEEILMSPGDKAGTKTGVNPNPVHSQQTQTSEL